MERNFLFIYENMEGSLCGGDANGSDLAQNHGGSGLRSVLVDPSPSSS